MAAFRTANPALNAETFRHLEGLGGERSMTIQGTVNRCGLLLIALVLPALYVWERFFERITARPGTEAYAREAAEAFQAVALYFWGGLIGGLLLALVTVFVKRAAPYTAPLYAVCEGLALGGLSALFEARFPAIVVQAVALTFGVFLGMLFLYKSGVVQATRNFRLGVAAATFGIFLVYGLSLLLRVFGTTIPLIHESGPVGIAFSLFVVVVAALNLVLDFDFIERGAEAGAPKYMEWYAAFGLLVTLVWLYIEILRLLAKLRGRR
jgi:uncharacterized YccA/Bax inhibitor family protein